MAGCSAVPVNLPSAERQKTGDRYGSGDGPEYVTLGKFGPNIGVDRIESVIRLNQHLQRSRVRHGVDRVVDRLGDGSVSAGNHHARADRGPRPDVGQRGSRSRSCCS
jgi:hypothetical protein